MAFYNKNYQMAANHHILQELTILKVNIIKLDLNQDK
jgi:hypothetical protein